MATLFRYRPPNGASDIMRRVTSGGHPDTPSRHARGPLGRRDLGRSLKVLFAKTPAVRDVSDSRLASYTRIRYAVFTIGVRQFSAEATVCVPALVFGAAGCAVAYLIFACFSPGEKRDSNSLAISSGAAAFGVSFLFWRIFCASPQLISARRGALVGILTGVLAHPVAWYLAIVWTYASGARTSLGDSTLNPLEGVPACFVYAGMSILLMGWLTVPAGGMLGWILGKVLRPRVP